MNFLIVLTLVATAAADVSHLFQNPTSNYLPPSNEYLPALNQQPQYSIDSLPQQGSYRAPSASFTRPASIYGAPGFGSSAPSASISNSFASTGFEAGVTNQYVAPTGPAVQPIQQNYLPAVQPTYQPELQATFRPAIQPIYQPQPQATFRPAIQPTYQPQIQETSAPAVDQSFFRPAIQPTYPAPQYGAPIRQTFSSIGSGFLGSSTHGSYSTSYPTAVTRPFSNFAGPTTVALISEPAPSHSFESDGYHYRNPNQY